MENEVLDEIKEEYNDISKLINSNFSEISELENNPIVKRYKYLKWLKNEVEFRRFNNSKDILDYCIDQKLDIKKTNDIWMYMFECPIEEWERITNTKISEEDKSKVIVWYANIENLSNEELVLKEKQKEFESTHKVVTGKETILDCYDRHYNLRHEFFTSCVEEGQDIAVQKILKKYSKTK